MKSRPPKVVERANLAIVGAGYAALNALNAASKYLPPKSRVLILDRKSCWGGMWPDAYSFVRLHQSYEEFTAGEREWAIRHEKPPEGHLATKIEVLGHFEHVLSAIKEETQLDLTELWGVEAEGSHKIVEEGAVGGYDPVKRVMFAAHPVLRRGANDIDVPHKYVIIADRLIRATGLDIRPPIRWTFPRATDATNTEADRLHTLTPADLSEAEWQARIRYGAAPILVVGSGKTAVDALLYLDRLVAPDSRRVRCIAGRGSWFWNRAVGSSPAFPRLMLELLTMYDGNNAAEIYETFARRGMFHSIVSRPFSFMSGSCSREELEGARRILGLPTDAGGLHEFGLDGTNGAVIKAHLVDAVRCTDGRGGFLLSLHSVGDGGGQPGPGAPRQQFLHVPPGTILLNCTDSIAPCEYFDPILSSDELVLSPQLACGFSGPSAHLLTHAWYLNRLEPLWRTLPRIARDPRRKDRMGLELQILVVLAAGMVGATLPREIRRSTKALPDGRQRQVGDDELRDQWLEALPVLVEKMWRIMPLRYDDERQEGSCSFGVVDGDGENKYGFLGGRIESGSSEEGEDGMIVGNVGSRLSKL